MPGFFVLSQTAIEVFGVLLSPFRFVIYILFFKKAERRRVREALHPTSVELRPPPLRPSAPAAGAPITIFISAGEASGELHAANLIEEIRARRANVRFVAFGGERLAEAGAETVLSLSREAGMGLLHGLSTVPHHVNIAQEFVNILEREKPAVCVFIDNPGFHLILASLARKRAVPAIQYICPQTWAWAPWRWRRLKRDVAALLAIVPFEVPYFESYGIRVRYVGHPIGDDFKKRTVNITETEKLRAGGTVVALFPGSRRAEVKRNLPAMLRVAARIQQKIPPARFILTTRDPHLAKLSSDLIQQLSPLNIQLNIEVRSGDPDAVLAAAAFAIAKSGTGTLEIALHRVPQVIIYKLARRFDLLLSKFLLTVPNISMLNLLSNREVVPEVMFVDDRDEDRIVEIALRYLQNENERTQQIRNLERAYSRIEPPGAAARAAEEVLKFTDKL
ncbi:MAG: lipid-A-disaccharide synthase [Planctomycetota bacterium]